MTSAPPSAPFDPIFDSQTMFRTVLDAMARPGSVGTLAASDPGCPLAEAGPLVALARTLLDHEVSFAVAPQDGAGDDAWATELAQHLVATTGSRPTSPDEADYVIARAPLARGLLTGLKRGSLAFPDDNATLIILTPAMAPDTTPGIAQADAGLRVTLTGPGVPGQLVARLSGLTAHILVERQEANGEAPRGLDLILVDQIGRVVCLPRTTAIHAD